MTTRWLISHYTKYSITFFKKSTYVQIMQDLVNLDAWSYPDLIERNNMFSNLRTFPVKFRFADLEFAAESKNWEKIENNNTFILKRVFSCKSGLLSHFHFSFRFSLRLRLAQVRVTSEFAKFAGVEPKLSKKANRYFYSRFVFCVDYWYELGVPTSFE